MTNIKPTYSNLNQKSHYSCGIGIGKPKEIIKKAKEKGLKGFAITDRYTAAGLLDFYFTAKKEEYPVALGIELFFFDNMNKINRIILIARNQEGYFNLCKLVSSSHNNVDMHKMPCISFYDLNEFKEGLYCLIDNYDYHSILSPIFKDHLIYEIIFDHEHIEKNKIIIQNTNKFIVTCNAFLPDESYKVLQDIMVDNASYGSHKEVFTESKHILSLKDLATKWQDHASYCTVANFMHGCSVSNIILEECSKIELKFHDQVVNFPHLLHPLNSDGCSKTELVWRIAKDYGRLQDNVTYKERFEYEMDAIQNNGRVDLIDYFLVLEDLCRWCRENGIMVGPGRGSGAGSLVNYCLKITHLDPIRFKLLFERFISKGRIQKGTLPDVDLDFSDPEKARQYLIEKYGHDRVIRIGTSQTLKAAGSVKDVARFFNPELDFQTINNVTRTFGMKDQEETELQFFERNCNENEVAKKFFDEFPNIRENVGRLLGYNRQYGTHPCFSGDSTILTDEGFKSFSELNGTVKKILTPSGWKRARFFFNGYKDIEVFHIKSSLYSNKTYISKNTFDHKFLNIDGNFENLSMNFKPSQQLAYDFDRLFVLLGWLWNDGTYLKNKKQFYLYFTKGKDEAIFNLLNKCEYELQDRSDRVLLSIELSKTLFDLGYCSQFVKDKTFPINWPNWNIMQKFSWLRGMFSANGFVIRGGVTLKLTSIPIIEKIYQFLKENGYVSANFIRNAPSLDGWKSRATGLFYLSFYGNCLFSKTIGFLQDYKNQKVKNKINFIQSRSTLKNQQVYDFTVLDSSCPVGLVNGMWAHNCGLAITQDSIFDFAPLRKVKGQYVLEFSASECEKSGIIKYDILGLMTLLFLQGCCDLVGIKDIYDIPLDDMETYKGFVDGLTSATFQFNSDVAINILGHLPLSSMCLDILSMTTSVGRPGPMKNGQHIEFFKRVCGDRFSTPPHPALEEELRETYGIMIYQESVMKASQILGGFTLAEADDIRKGMGKKDPKVLAPYKERFVNHCWIKYPDTKFPHTGEDGQSHGTVAEHIWDLMATFSGYGFNKSHSMSYALIGYYCQYLKTHYPLHWWISCLKVVDADKLREYYSAAKEYCVDPDINLSEMEYVINENKKIQFPFTAIKGLGPKATEEIYKCRPFTSFEYFISRVNKTRVNKTVVLRLIYSGCFESLHPNQKQELINKYFISRKEKVPVELSALTTYQLNENRITSLSFLSVDLYEIYGDRFSDKLTRYDEQIKAKTKVYVLGTIKKITIKKTKTDKEYGVIEITNSGESTKLRIWEDEINIYKESLLKEKKNIKFHCATSEYNNTVQMTILGMEEL